jgi:hypothetical protein
VNINMDLTPIVIVSIVFLTAAVIVATVFLFMHKAKELRHATIRLALEKGQPLPPGLLDPAEAFVSGRLRHGQNDLAKGVKLVFIGVGLSLFFLVTGYAHWGIGLIVLFVGLGHLVSHALVGRSPPDAPPAV